LPSAWFRLRGVTVEEHLRALSVWVMEVTNYDIHQGATGALAAT
jgi:hypothetical protein